MSLRLRLLVAVGAVAAVALVVLDVFTYRELRSFLYTRVDQSLQDAHIPIEQAIGGGGGPRGFRVSVLGIYVEWRDSTGAVLQETPSFTRSGQATGPRLPAVIGGLSTSSDPNEPVRYLTAGSAEQGGPPFRVRVSNLREGGQLILAVPLSDTIATLHHLLVIEIAVTVAALVAAAALGWWLVRVGLKPLHDVERTAAAIAEGQLDRRVPGDSAQTEVGRLARALNVMLGRIADAFAARDATEAELRRSEERMRRFVGDASHELRTPLAAVAAYAELFERGASEQPEDLARVMSGIRIETGRMASLVHDLFLLARLDEGQALELQPVDLAGLAAEAVDTARAVGPEWPVGLETGPSVEVVGDPTRLRQVLDNLLANVRAHTPPGTNAVLRVFTDDGDAVVEVSDAGPGLTDEQANRVFERFYRVDPSRSRQHGGAGLGLGIVSAIVAAHGGSVRAAGVPGGGATFRVRLPRVIQPAEGAGDHAATPA